MKVVTTVCEVTVFRRPMKELPGGAIVPDFEAEAVQELVKVEVRTDLDAMEQSLARIAARNDSGRATRLHGRQRARVLKAAK